VNELIPPFDFQKVVIDTWTNDPLGDFGRVWIMLLGFLVTAACGLVGNFLILRRMALIGDAISHSVLAGIALVFLLLHSIGAGAMLFGALMAGMATVLIIQVIEKKSRVKQDAAIGIAFTSLFAIGVILVHRYMGDTHFDSNCILYGDMIGAVGFLKDITLSTGWAEFCSKLPIISSPHFLNGNELKIPPAAVIQMIFILILVVVCIRLFYKELLVCSFDPALAVSLGINATAIHFSLMSVLSITVVSAFGSVGAILVIAMLILPGATAQFLTQRLPVILWLTLLHALISSILGMYLARWLNVKHAGAMVVAGTGLFILAWLASPIDGPIAKWRRRHATQELPEELAADPTAAE
jgi:manganese/zinc/iron transport system permease protein